MVARLVEGQARIETTQQDMRRALQRLARQVGGLSQTMGGDIEDIAYIVLHDVLGREFGWNVGVLQRTWQPWDGEAEEINVFGRATDPAPSGQTIWIVGEAKHNLTLREHKSWVVWQEGKGPDVVIELLSERTAALDKGEKKQIYQECLRVPEYFWFDPFSAEWAGFALQEGVYQPLAPDARERLVSGRVGLALVRWEGAYQGVRARWLRWATLEGPLLPTGPELAERAQQQSVAAQAHAAVAQQHAAAAQEQAAVAQQQAAELETLLARYRERFGELPE